MNSHFNKTHILLSLFLVSMLFLSPSEAKEPIYVTYFTHQQASPIRGVPNVVQSTNWQYTGQGPAPYSTDAKNLIESWEKAGIKGEYATTAVCLQQLLDDFPDTVEKIKRLKIPVSLYPGAGHVAPCPVGRLRETPAMRDLIYGRRQVSLEDMIRAEWYSETHTLVPDWHLDEKGRLVEGNPRAGMPITLDELPLYNLPKNENWLYGGVLAIQRILGVTPLDFFLGRFENIPREELTSVGTLTAVRRALGIGQFKMSWNPGHPYRTAVPANLDFITKIMPRDVPIYIGRGGDVQTMLQRKNDFRIVWPDPDSNQWKAENSALEFYRKTYGVNSLREVLEMEPPVEKIIALMSDEEKERCRRPIVARPEAPPGLFHWDPDGVLAPGSWRERLITDEEFETFPDSIRSLAGFASNLRPHRPIPDYLQKTKDVPAQLPSATKTVSSKALVEAANQLLLNWPESYHGGYFGAPPDFVQAGGERLSLAGTFQAFVAALNEFGRGGKLPKQVTVHAVHGPTDYPMYDLPVKPTFDPEQERGGWLPRVVPAQYIVSSDAMAAQGIPAMDFPGTATMGWEDLRDVVQKLEEVLNNEKRIPGTVKVKTTVGSTGPGAKKGAAQPRETTVNAAELLFGMAMEVRIIHVTGAPDKITMDSLRIIEDQASENLVPESVEWVSHYAYRPQGFLWREKVPTWLLHNAWNYPAL